MKSPALLPLLALVSLVGCQSPLVPRATGSNGQPAPVARQAARQDVAGEGPEELPKQDAQAPTIPLSLDHPPEILPQVPLEPQALSLFDAAALALAQNPDLIAARQAEGVSLGAVGVAQTYPFNPWVQVQVTPDPQLRDGSDGTSAHYVLLMQTLQLAHQRQHRQAAAASVLNGTRWNIVQAELLAVAQTERLYFAALYQRGLADISHANADLSRELLAISEKQLRGGQLSAADVAIVRLDESAARRRAELAQTNFQTALLDLRRQLNLPLSISLTLRENLADFQFNSAVSAAPAQDAADGEPPATDLQDLAWQFAAARPDVLAAQSDLDAARANLNLARANKTPDLQIGPYYQKTDGGATLWGLRAQSDLPILNSGQPLVRQRMAEINQRQIVWEQLQQRASLEAQAAIDRYDRARKLAAGSGIGRELPQELSKLEAQFKAGEIDVLRIVTARSSLLAARQAQLETLNEVAQAAAALTAATGLPPEAVVQGRHAPAQQ
jgi:outer membrane protein, heavy metal efflux system